MALILGCAAAASAEPRSSKLSARTRHEAKEKGTAKVEVLVRFRRHPGAAERSLVRAFGGQIRREFRRGGWIALRVPAHRLAKLAEHPNVEFVAADAPVAGAMDVARQTAGEPPVTAHESALKGAGVTIAVVDSGVAQHPEIQTLIAAVDFTVEPQRWGVVDVPTTAPELSVDPYGHGTHVAGIMVANGSLSAGGRHAGIAPAANLVSVRVLDEAGSGLTSEVLAGLQWIADNKDELGIRVVNLSLGHPVYEPAAYDPLVQAVEALWDAGVVVVCSAGNSGRAGSATVTSPCNSRKVITVGALNDRNTADTADDAVASYSSRGPTLGDLVAKPDLLAPGNRIVSLRSAGSSLDLLFPERRVAADPAEPEVVGHVEMSGTSMAAPIVAATAALMLEQDQSLNPGTIKARLMASARKAAVGDPFASGAGALDIQGALRATGRVADAPSPRIFPDAARGMLGVENTGVLWGDSLFTIDAVWAASVLWSVGTQWSDPIVWSYAVVQSSTTDATASLLSADAELWPEAELWPDSALWSEAELWPDAAALGELWPDDALGSLADLWPDDQMLSQAELQPDN
ncbi:MAG: S8 family peptidase [Vicinamibacteria bacterium]